MVLFIYIFAILGLVLILLGIFGKNILPGQSRVQLGTDSGQSKKIRMYSYLAGIFPFSQRFLEKIRLYNKIKHKLEVAHIRFSPAAFFNIKLIAMICTSVAVCCALGKIDPLAILISCAFAYIIPDIVLNRKISQRKEMVVKLLPETVDLLGLCVEAGLDFTTAVKWVIDKTPVNPMVEELAFVLEEIKWGKPRTQALRDMSKRLQIPEISSFVQTLVLAERMGTPVAEAFVILSEDTRLQRFHRGERFAMRAPIKILLPLIFCILPVIGIVIGGPIFLQFMQKKLF